MVSITDDDRESFQRDGFLKVENLISVEVAKELREHFDDLFRGNFPTGIYPDEWHWREGISKPEKFREIVNAWKSSDLVASVACSEQIAAAAAKLMGWSGVRLGQDDVLWKPPGASGVGYHQDSAYISQNFRPLENNSVTVWIALDDADEETGVVEYAAASHRWPKVAAIDATTSSFHGAEDELAPVRRAATKAGAALEIRRLAVPMGSAIFHHQDVWHGSGANRSSSRPRRALGVHLLSRDVTFRTDPRPDYIYGRYVLSEGSGEVSEQFFPILWTSSGYVSPVLRRAKKRPMEVASAPGSC